MKQTTKMSQAVSQLEHIYNALNADFFTGEPLPVSIITVQSKPGTRTLYHRQGMAANRRRSV